MTSELTSIGILTFHRGPNYGGFLQAWHTREALRSLGLGATVINYQGHEHFLAESLGLTGWRLEDIRSWGHRILKQRPFRSQVKELSNQPLVTNAEAIDWQRYSHVVVGSDIVWDFSNTTFGNDRAYYAALPSQIGPKWIAYATSCGEANAEGRLPEHVLEGLKNFKAIRVRDKSTALLVERALGVRPEIVVDPTWLQSDPDIPFRKRPRVPYCLVYGLGTKGTRGEILKQYCRQRNLLLVEAVSQCRAADFRIHSIGPFEWVDLFRHAECVVTSTFHGLLYAIKYRKPVLFMVRGPSRNKSQIIIERCGLNGRVIEENCPFTAEFLDFTLHPSKDTTLPLDWIEESRNLLQASLL